MDNTERAQTKVKQFKDISEADQRLLDRLTIDREEPRRNAGLENLDLTPLAAVFRRTVRDTSDIRNIFQVMPDLKLNREILVSAVVAPGDLTTTSLIFSNGLKNVDSALTSQLLAVPSKFFLDEQHLERKVPEWIDDALVMSGAHPILILPEASLDKMLQSGVNSSSMESVSSYGGEYANNWFRPKGVFGLRVPTSNDDDHFISLESSRGRIDQSNMLEYHTIKVGEVGKKQVKLPFRVTDNLAALRMPAVQQIQRARGMEKAYGVPSLESRRRDRRAAAAKTDEVDGKKIGNAEVFSKFFKRPQAIRKSRLMVVPNQRQSEDGKASMGHPIEYHLASESVMPVTVPGDETNHVGYLIFLDQNGFPVSSTSRMNYYDDVRKGAMGGDQVGSAGAVSGELINMSKEAISGGIANASDAQIDRLAALAGQLIDADLLARLRTGLMGGHFEISRPDHVNRLMFARLAKNQQTTILYVPAEMMIYLAYEYNEYGIGKSILEDAKTLAAMRAALLVANVIGGVKNAIPGKNINIKLDPSDKDPLGSATFMAQEALGLAYRKFPMTLSTPMGLAEELQMSSMSLNITGNELFPDIETSVTAKDSSYQPVDPELLKDLRDSLTRVFSQTPEMTDGINQADFATTVLQNNLMLLKRVMVLQDKTNPQITDYARVFTMSSGILLDEMMEIIEKNPKLLPKEYKDEPESFLEDFINNMTMTLPEPETDNLVKQVELFKNYSLALDEIIPAFIREEYFDGHTPDDIREAIPTAIAAWKGKLQRDFLRKRGLFKDMDIFANNEDGSPMMNLNEEMAGHMEGIKNSFEEYMKLTLEDAAARKKRNEEREKLAAEAEAAKTADAPAEAPYDPAAPTDGSQPAEEQPIDTNGIDADGNVTGEDGAAKDHTEDDLDAPPDEAAEKTEVDDVAEKDAEAKEKGDDGMDEFTI